MFTKSTLTALIASVTLGSFSEPAFATLINSDINMSESDLREKCNASGGDFTKYSDGTYGCIINNADGPLVTISCDADQSCIGTKGRQGSARDRKAKTQFGGAIVQGTASSTGLKKNMMQRGTMATVK